MKSTELTEPIAISAPIAYAGSRNTIPETATGSGLASIATGFPDITMQALNDGGLPPRGEDCNGMFYLSTDQRVYLQNGGIITFNQDVSDLIGGYPKNAILDYIDSSNTYHKVQSLIDDNTYNFVTNPDYIDDVHWQEISLGGGSGGGLEVGDIGFTQGFVNESKNLKRILNGQLVTKSDITQYLFSWFNTAVAQNPDMATTETLWQEENEENGMCGKFVYTEESTINYYAYTSDSTTYFTTTTEDSESVDVYNTEFELQGTGSLEEGVLTYEEVTYNRASGSDDSLTTPAILRLPNYPSYLIGNVSEENQSIYEISGTYFIQIAADEETEVEIINEIELNNPFTLFDSRYAEAQLYNASWLKSSEEYYSKSIYVTAYEALVVENNAGISAGESVSLPSGTTYVKRGLSVKLSTDEDITDYDFVINTTDETFRLPLKNGTEGMFGTSLEPEGWSLYYYVGETTQNANLIDAGRIPELVAGKANADLSNCTRPYIIETYQGTRSWYRVWSDGFCMQGGVYNNVSSSTTSTTITLLKTLSDTTTGTIAQVGQYNASNDGTCYAFRCYLTSTSTMSVNWVTSNLPLIAWFVTGYVEIDEK